MRTPRQRGQNRRDHRTRPALFLALGPMVVAAPAAAAAVDAHAVDPATPADSVLQPQLSAGPNGTFTIRVGPPGADVVAMPADPSGAPTPTASAASPDSGPAVAGDTASPPSNATGAAATPTPTPGPYTVTVTPRPNGPVPSTFGSPELDAQLQQARAQITALVANALRAAIAARAAVPVTPSPSLTSDTPADGANAGTPGSSTSSPAPSASSSSTPGDQLPSFPRTTTSSAAPSATPSGGARTGQSSREPALTAAPTTAGVSTSTPCLLY